MSTLQKCILFVINALKISIMFDTNSKKVWYFLPVTLWKCQHYLIETLQKCVVYVVLTPLNCRYCLIWTLQNFLLLWVVILWKCEYLIWTLKKSILCKSNSVKVWIQFDLNLFSKNSILFSSNSGNISNVWYTLWKKFYYSLIWK